MILFFKNIVRRNAIKKYIKHLGPLLVSRYGRLDFYSRGQVDATIREHKFNSQHCRYAYVMYLSEQSFYGVYGEKLSNEYASLRIEIARDYFNGNTNFETTSVFVKGTGSNLDGDEFSE